MSVRSLPRVIGVTAALLALGATTSAALFAARSHRPALPYYTGADLTPRWISSQSPELAAVHRVADWTLTDQTGSRVRATDLDGKIYVAAFFFTECRGFCPTLRSNLTTVAHAFRNDSGVAILSHTVTPQTDDAAKLAAYAKTNGIQAPQWRLLTGNMTDIARLAHASYFVELSDTTASAPGGLIHTETVVLVDRSRRIRGVYDGTLPFDVARLIEDIRTLEREAGT